MSIRLFNWTRILPRDEWRLFATAKGHKRHVARVGKTQNGQFVGVIQPITRRQRPSYGGAVSTPQRTEQEAIFWVEEQIRAEGLTWLFP